MRELKLGEDILKVGYLFGFYNWLMCVKLELSWYNRTMSKKTERMKALIKEVLEDLLDEEESQTKDQEVQLPEEVTQTIEEEQTTVQEVVTESTEEDIVDNSDLTSKIEELEKELESQKAQNKK